VATAAPAGVVAAGIGDVLNDAGRFCPSTHEANSLSLTVYRRNFMLACDVPQYSVQKPFQTAVPTSSLGVNHIRLTRLLIKSRLPPIWGTQNECSTSLVSSVRLTVRPVGMYISLAVEKPYCGYLNSHQHWWPMTWTSTASEEAGDCVSKIAFTVGIAMITRMKIGSTVHVISRIVLPCTICGGGPPSRFRNRMMV